ncbi:P-type conjugative transfer protein TrbL [Agrobacterium pusense]|uniref:P-type conjugative transfer protein TrbL n=1 Tax=Agrobacterium pusense TaxID=648995 RepID=UPI001C6F33E7|nr:P-type conjugative transfer protein TrbL [Agrobacterium pusense]MBW9069958.1 P-type conjugative transfer protein TrbL [Agrobacterium pusense]MBW9084803.1 P-type conjugative transfer protein TrbL [Agrobacterium pusense]MBW9125323.1 P-type conjugative transfer protein TrbL [Agrobacterium pusense]MBW9137738.1 P-type conjugative transfer protein TrbL [Agrobacterium pusense]
MVAKPLSSFPPSAPALIVLASIVVLGTANAAVAADGSVLTTVENQVVSAAKGWETTVTNAARSLFWLLAGIEVAIAAVWLAIQAASIEAWFSELVRRIMFVGFFAFMLVEGPDFAKSVVDSLFQIGGGSGSASPADVFNAGLTVSSAMSQKISFGLFQDNALALSASLAMIVSVIAFSLVAAIFLSVLVEMYVGLLAGMIMLGLGGSSFTKDFAIRYLIYSFSVGMKLMALVMIAKIGSDVLIGLAGDSAVGDQYQSALAIAGIAVVVFILAMYVPSIIQGVVQGASVGGGMEAIRHGGQAASAALGAGFLISGATKRGFGAASAARAGGASLSSAALRGMQAGIGGATGAVGSAVKEKAIGSPGAYAGSMLGLANAKLDQPSGRPGTPPPPPPIKDSK